MFSCGKKILLIFWAIHLKLSGGISSWLFCIIIRSRLSEKLFFNKQASVRSLLVHLILWVGIKSCRRSEKWRQPGSDEGSQDVQHNQRPQAQPSRGKRQPRQAQRWRQHSHGRYEQDSCISNRSRKKGKSQVVQFRQQDDSYNIPSNNY